MKQTSAGNGDLPPAAEGETSIIGRREIMPLLAKAGQALKHYDSAMGCLAAIIDSSGRAIHKQTPVCEFCVKNTHEPLRVCQESECPCHDVHQEALDESRRTGGVYVYSCAAGFVFWTSPLYRNGRYAGAMTAGQVILGGRGMALERFRGLCNNKDAVQMFSAMIKDMPEKSHEEVKAMAEMLGLCAGEISKGREGPCELIRRKIWQNVPPQNAGGTPDQASKDAPQDSGADGSRLGVLEKERTLVAAFRRGDNKAGCRILKELMDCAIAVAGPENMELVRFRAIELVVLLSRAGDTETCHGDTLLEANNRNLNRILESKTTEDLIENLYQGAERIAGKIFSFQGMRHAAAIRKAERYIWENYTRKISLQEIAQASGLSAPYFSTIFKEEMGENLSFYLNRLRVEKTVALLTETGKPLSEIAKLCGFEDQSWFSKTFKSFTGISPGKFRESGGGYLAGNRQDTQTSPALFNHKE
ncbi:MAG: PocR ligand-binding domain-containing protein [Treponema sp.]|nr:PocR ligand-binding domain-containing protein [Treponema sp.]